MIPTRFPFWVFIALLLFGFFISSCNGHQQTEALSLADSLIEASPDSALTILENIEDSGLDSRRDKANYALLMSMALDKNYVDTTTFDILQPAIDYYLKNGDTDEKLRTCYYQGRIYQNRGERDSALNCFIKGIDISPGCTDSLTFARTLVALASIYNDFYDFEGYTDCHLRAARIYKSQSRKEFEFDCLLNALNGAIILNNKTLADSLLRLCTKMSETNVTFKNTVSGYHLSYIIKFKTKKEISDFLDSNLLYSNFDTNGLLNLANAYNEISEYQKASALLKAIKEIEHDTLKYQAIYTSVLENSGAYKEALYGYKNFYHLLDSITALRFNQKSQSIKEKHQIELSAQADANRKSRIIWFCIAGIMVLSMSIVILLMLIRHTKFKREIALEQAKAADLEKENLQLENDKKVLEAENLCHRIEDLESECESLRYLLENRQEIPSEVQDAIKARINMLNTYLAGYITNNTHLVDAYDSEVREITENIEEFMNTTRLAFQVSHPQFIRFFEEHNLTEKEINYVCLYALGLKGKEVGKYMKKPSHVNISSAIRKKLGIDKHETNIGIYVRRLLKNM